jgi:uncharacterized protein (DUF427 family)
MSETIASRHAGGQASGKPVKIPGPEHPITIAPNPGRVIVSIGGQQVADTREALTLSESSYAPVQYVPVGDVDMELLTPSDHESYCPFKGDASYYSVPSAGERGVNLVWEYREPFDAVAQIRGHVAFYADRAEIDERF